MRRQSRCCIELWTRIFADYRWPECMGAEHLDQPKRANETHLQAHPCHGQQVACILCVVVINFLVFFFAGDPDEWEQNIQINLTAPMRLTRRLTPAMVKKGEVEHLLCFVTMIVHNSLLSMQHLSLSIQLSAISIKQSALPPFTVLHSQGHHASFSM